MRVQLTLAIAQYNAVVGDITGNAARMADIYQDAVAKGANIVVFPELALTGYPPEDLILIPAFRKQAMDTLQSLARMAKNAALVTGSVWEENGAIYNAAVAMQGRKIVHVQPKTMLPNYGIFDEKRLFSPGTSQAVVELQGVRVGLLVCEDVWSPSLAVNLGKDGAELLIAINASPFEINKRVERKKWVAHAAKESELPIIYANMVGGQDDIVFDGGSFIVSPTGEVEAQLPEFAENLSLIALNDHYRPMLPAHAPLYSTEETLWKAMVLGLRDYVRKNGFSNVVLGLSGGIDSALSAAIAVDALGAEHVKGVLLPSPFTSRDSMEDAQALAENLGIETIIIPINEGMHAFEGLLNPVLGERSGWQDNLAVGGNIQARLRGMTLMALSNHYGWLLLSTGNKSEIAVGYTTLYGDSCGAFNVLKDLYKTQVYEMSEWKNSQSRPVIPRRSITKAPSAELAPGQTDQDQLPPYDVLDGILKHHIEGRKSAEEIIAEGFAPAVVEKILRMVRASEYKRRQSCPGVKLSSMMFGRDRRYPLTNKNLSA